MDDLITLFEQPDPNYPLRYFYFPKIASLLRSIQDHDAYASYKIIVDPERYVHNIFNLYYSELVRQADLLLTWAQYHYPSGDYHHDVVEYRLYVAIMNAGGYLPVIDPVSGRDRLSFDHYVKIIDGRDRICLVKRRTGNLYAIREHHLHDVDICRHVKTISEYEYAKDGPMPLDSLDLAVVQLSASQKAVIRHARTHAVTFALGGAGTGKSTIIMMILRQYIACGRETDLYILCPTHMAAENLRLRLAAVLDFDLVASLQIITIHTFAYKKPTVHPRRTFIIFEEASMYDNLLGQIISLNNTNGRECTYLFVGDHNQLRPVRRHSVLRVLMAAFPKLICYLTDNFRSGDLIIQNATEVLYATGVARLRLGAGYNVYQYSLSSIIDWEAPFDPDPRVAPPMFITHRNADVLRINAALRDSIMRREDSSYEAPTDPAEYRIRKVYKNGTPIGLWEWRIGDRARCCAKDKSGRIFNGAMCTIAAFDGAALVVEYRDELFQLPSRNLWPAYCITVHNSQGQEWDEVVFCDLSGSDIERSLAYVGLTRAKKKQHIIRVNDDPELLATDFRLVDEVLPIEAG